MEKGDFLWKPIKRRRLTMHEKLFIFQKTYAFTVWLYLIINWIL